MTFDPNDHMIQLGGRDYLEVKWRLVWFRQDHPNAFIITEILEHDRANKYAVVRATIDLANASGARATGHSLTEPTSVAKDYIANAETSAIGRALAHLGYGTQFADLDQAPDTLADSPVARKPAPPTATLSHTEATLAWLARNDIARDHADEVALARWGREVTRLSRDEARDLMLAFKDDLVRADPVTGTWVITAPPASVPAGNGTTQEG